MYVFICVCLYFHVFIYLYMYIRVYVYVYIDILITLVRCEWLHDSFETYTSRRCTLLCKITYAFENLSHVLDLTKCGCCHGAPDSEMPFLVWGKVHRLDWTLGDYLL